MRDAVAATGLRFEELDEKRAVELGCVSAVQRMQRQGRLSRQEYLCEAAARSGQLEKLKALRANGWPWDKSTCWAAALGGHLEVLLWARANGCPWDEQTCSWAARGGHLEVLQWAHANGCPWDKWTCWEAAKGGKLEVLQWARANGCPWDEMELHIAAENGHEAVMRLLIKAGADVNKVTDNGATPLYVAAQEGHETVVRALIELGVEVNKAKNNGATALFGRRMRPWPWWSARGARRTRRSTSARQSCRKHAAHKGHEAVVRALIEAGADVNKARDNGARRDTAVRIYDTRL